MLLQEFMPIWARGGQVDQAARVGHRQRTQQNLVEQRENRPVCANAEAKRQNRHGRHERRPEQRP
jgi:hypothetical protein